MQRLCWLLCVVVAAACGPVVEPQEPRTEDGKPLLVSFESATLDEARTTLRLDFTGGGPFDINDACTNDYAVSAEMVGDVLEVGITQLVHRRFPNGPEPINGVPVGCDAAGHARTAFVSLTEPFDGTTVRDRAGYVHFVRAPDGLVGPPDLPAGWELRSERSVQESPTGRWQRTWSTLAEPPLGTNRDRVDLYQAFGGPASVSGGDDQQRVEVNDTPATLYGSPPGGDLVLTWFFEGDGLALVVNERDFGVTELIDLAESVKPAPRP